MAKMIEILGTLFIVFAMSDLRHHKIPKWLLVIVTLIRLGLAITFGIGTFSLWWSWSGPIGEKLFVSVILGLLSIFCGYLMISSARSMRDK